MDTERLAPVQRGPRWLHPRTLSGTVLLSGLIFAVGPPLSQALLHMLFADERKFDTPAEWLRFVVVSVCMGLVVGAAWYALKHMRRGWWRTWGTCFVWMIAFSMAQARRFAPGEARWLVSQLVMSAIMSAIVAVAVLLFADPGTRGESPGRPSDRAA